MKVFLCLTAVWLNTTRLWQLLVTFADCSIATKSFHTATYIGSFSVCTQGVRVAFVWLGAGTFISVWGCIQQFHKVKGWISKKTNNWPARPHQQSQNQLRDTFWLQFPLASKVANFITEIEFTCAVSTVSFKATYAAANIRPFSICTQGVGITSVSKGAVTLIEIYETVTEMVWQRNCGYGDVHMLS